MPWQETGPLDQRLKLVTAYLAREGSMVRLCAELGIAPKTGFKWVKRFKARGREGLVDLPTVARRLPHKTAEDVEDLLVALKVQFPNWGPKKLLDLMREFYPELERPAPSTAGEILKRHALVKPCPQRRRTELRRATHLVEANAPNDTWATDHKGNFELGNGRRCYPLTVTDSHSRFILACEVMTGINGAPVKKVFEHLFLEYGLPLRIRTDNGSPFGASRGLALSKLSLWWMRLGIRHERIEPGRPQQNGRHERMHATLKEVTDKPMRHAALQQECFNEFVEIFNHLRPHEALGMKRPASVYRPSPREMPKQLPPLEYPPHYVHKTIGPDGRFSYRRGNFFISKVLGREVVGLEPIDEDTYRVWAGTLPLGIISLRTKIFTAYDEDEQRAVA
jgi:putative transposase